MSNNPALKEKKETAGYSYNHGVSNGGYSSGPYGYDESAAGGGVQRTLQDYILILRERIWYVVVVFLVVFSSALVYTMSETKIYQANVSVQIFRSDPTIMQVKQVVDTDIRSAEDLNTQIKVIESGLIVQKVEERLTGDDLRAFLAPYETGTGAAPSVASILASGRKVALQRLTLFVLIGFQHPDPVIAAKVANLFAEAYIEYNKSLRADASRDAVSDLADTIAEQKKKVDRLAAELQVYKEKNNMVSLDSRKDIVNDSLKQVNAAVTSAQLALAAAETKLSQIKDRRANGGDLTELTFISSQPLISQLVQQVAAKKIELAQLRERYREKHPNIIEANQSLAQTETELKRAIDSACALIEADYEHALTTYKQSKQELESRSEQSLELDRLALNYNSRELELRTQQQLLTSIIARQSETSLSSTFQTQNAAIVDRAVPPALPISPNVKLNVGLGVLGGLGLGLAFAFFVAFIDDRVKSSFDIEGVVGLPLIGVIPQIKRMDNADKAQIVVNNADRQVSEAFLTLHSSLRLKDESKNAKCILITSTIPGEGKSFTTTNLALTFAAHGEKVVIVDGDLRKPNIHKSFRVENLRGIIDVCSGKLTLDDVIVRDVQPNLDILPAGGRAKNPTQVLNSKGFEMMLSDLRKRYDRVFVDTPPLAAVSDALVILPLVDGSIFTIFFNKVRRKAAQFSAKRLLEANVPNFGAVLNGLNLAVSGYYYAQYYDKSYKDYYVVVKDDSSPER